MCDEENAGKVSLTKTVELIKSGKVPDHAVDEIAELCWNQSSNYLNKTQFYSALKLVAAYQANHEINRDILTSQLELPLPRFTWNKLGNESPIPDLIELSNDLSIYKEQIDTTSTDSEFDSDTLSLARNGSPGLSSTASDSPTPTNSCVQDRTWGMRDTWHGLVSEEQTQLLGTEEESSDRHSSDDETEVTDDVWTITPEQCNYYINQFRTMQSDLKALIPGSVARTYFGKSRLPVQDLRKIWQLADVTRDGALSLQEFMTAMHLVVLKRNDIDIPDVLPPGLIPSLPSTREVSKPSTPEVVVEQKEIAKEPAKEWTRFVESPTNSNVSSPGAKPVNFDFQKSCVDNNPKILHPVALRLTPEMAQQALEEKETVDGNSPKPEILSGPSLLNSAIQRPQPKKIQNRGVLPPPPGQQPSEIDGPVSLPAFPPPKKDKPPPPPPRSFKTHGRSSSLDLNRLAKVGGPPVVPPRVSPNIQSGKRLVNQRSEGDYSVASGCSDIKAAFADFDQFEKYENVQEGIFPGEAYEAERKQLFAQFETDSQPRRHGAFEVYRKPNQGRDSSPTAEDKLKWEMFLKMQEENTVLLRLCQELSQELADVREEKLALKVRLEKLMNGG